MAISIHWKAPLQTKGFLKIIELLVAVLCFSLVAGYYFEGSQRCINSPNNYTLTVDTSYPFYSYHVSNQSITRINNGTPVTPINQNGTTAITPLSLDGNFVNFNVGQGAQLFVTWGVFSMLYCIVALVVYMVVTANEKWEKIMDILVYVDLVGHIIWVFFWFVACVDWAVSYNQLFTDVRTVIEGHCPHPFPTDFSYGSSAQAGIAVVFGFLSLFLWGVNIFWVVIDTPFYIQWKANRASSGYQATP